MNFKTSKEIRESWVNFFTSKGHKHVKSSSLIPDNPTLLLTGAGMVQFVPYFLGLKESEFKRAVTIQKCARVGGKDSDLENIGRTTRHHTFFEMLGNFSFGDYFKGEVIPWAWEYVTEVLGLPKDKLIVSVFAGDEITPFDSEAYDIWTKKVGLPDSQIKKMGRKDVFWGPPGPTGPCGPCSEIYFDRGTEFTDYDERYLEIWNLVFMQLEKDEEGKFKPLAKKNIDTGAGLERLALILQNKKNTFETDLLMPILNAVSELTKTPYERDEKSDLSLKIITDHIRCICFLIGDGVRPSNLGRGYVLRMLIRRAARFGYLLGNKEPFLYKLANVVKSNYQDSYEELKDKEEILITTIQHEEKKFAETIERGLIILDELLSKSGEVISGDAVFDLYSTYGFPVELTADIAKEKNKNVDLEAFEQAKEKHSEISNKNAFSVKLTGNKAYTDILSKHGQTKFTGYEVGYVHARHGCTVISILNSSGEKVVFLREGELGQVILNQTPFYAESGGQKGDKGLIHCPDPKYGYFELEVFNTIRFEGVYIHLVKVISGKVGINSPAVAEVDPTKRHRTRKHHSVTHLMHAALRKVFGNAVQQAGSEVDENRTRFDITLDKSATPEEIEKIESMVNGWINLKLPVECKEMTFDEAIKTGALAFFGDKYGDVVRVIKMGDAKEVASVELCGGTHIKNTSEIGGFKIVKESSIAAGVRRIEAVAGEALKEYLEIQTKEEIRKLQLIIEELRQSIKKLESLNLKDESRELKTYEVIGESINKPMAPFQETLKVIGEALEKENKLTLPSRETFKMMGEALEKENKLTLPSRETFKMIGESIQRKNTETKKTISKYEASTNIEKLKSQEDKIEKLSNGISILIAKPDNYGGEAIKSYIEGKLKSVGAIHELHLPMVILITDVTEDSKLTFYCGVSNDLIPKGIKAKDIVNKVAEVTGGRGGGKDNFAQAGGKDTSKINEALKTGKELVLNLVSI